MQLFRRRPEYVHAMLIQQSGGNIEYVVQPVDHAGKPTGVGTNVRREEFELHYEPMRRRPRAAKKPTTNSRPHRRTSPNPPPVVNPPSEAPSLV